LAAVLATAASLLAACGGSSGPPTLIWYINPDPPPPAGFSGAFGQAGIAERCSTDQYKIETQILPTSASDQRVQLLRRLAAQDSSIDLMSLDPVFTAEFAAADFLQPFSSDVASQLSDGVLKGAVAGASWDGKLVVAPLWANTHRRCGQGGRRGRCAGQQVRGLRRLDQRPDRWSRR
jgi:multiple sugar transport system substrate-binding protein